MKKIRRFFRKHNLKPADVILIVVIILICVVQGLRWSNHESPISGTTNSPDDQVKIAFVHKIAPIAENEQRKFHVLASITIAQAALESDWGQSELSQKYNNLFGVKGTGTNSALMTTNEYVNGQWITVKANFVVYPSWNASIEAHTQLLVNGLEGDPQHYQHVIEASNYQEAANALQDNGYATDPQYAQKLIDIIQKYQLDQYDKK